MKIFDKIAAAFTTNFSWWYVLDIIIMMFVCYAVMAFLRRRHLMPLLKFLILGVTVVAVVMGLADNLVVSAVLASTLAASFIAISAVAFQSELRRGLFKLASPRREADHYNTKFDCTDEELSGCISEVVRGCSVLAKNNIGALIVLQHKNMPEHIIDSGTRLGAVVSSAVLECLFNTKAPLHDGAVIIEGNRIVAAGCFLPLSQSPTLPKELGTRHRAGIGITESVDVLAVIVSEETGVISLASNGNIDRYYDANMLSQALEQFYGLQAVHAATAHKRRM